MKIVNKREPFSIEVKRFYVPATITDTCPECGEKITLDLMERYLSYPTANAPDTFTMYHYNEDNEDEHEWEVKVVLRVTLEAAP